VGTEQKDQKDHKRSHPLRFFQGVGMIKNITKEHKSFQKVTKDHKGAQKITRIKRFPPLEFCRLESKQVSILKKGSGRSLPSFVPRKKLSSKYKAFQALPICCSANYAMLLKCRLVYKY